MSDKDRLETINMLRDLTPREHGAMWLYHTEYALQRKGAIEFYAGLPQFEKNRVDEMLHDIESTQVAALEQRAEEVESERDMLRTVLDDTDKAELLEALEQSTKEALNLKQRVNELETDGCGQCEACENFFPVSLLSITDDDVMLCPGDWDEVLSATADLSKETT